MGLNVNSSDLKGAVTKNFTRYRLCFMFLLGFFIVISALNFDKLALIQNIKYMRNAYGKNTRHIIRNKERIIDHNGTDKFNIHKRALDFVKAEGIAPLSDPSAIWPEMDHDIRMRAQLQYVPRDAVIQSKKENPKIKTILVYDGFKRRSNAKGRPGREIFLRDNCPVNTCTLTDDRSLAKMADVLVIERFIIFSGLHQPKETPKHQIRVFFCVEAPPNTPRHTNTDFSSSINWTATYRRDSTIPIPYGYFSRYNESVRFKNQTINYATGKTKKVAWFVSNCNENNDRRKLARELSKYIDIDIYGLCGSLKCPVDDSERCFKLLDTTYKFYLAFENSNCRDYITEKFFENSLSRNVIPIVYGAHKDDYLRVAPPHSFIHVDDFESPKQLAEYLHKLDENDHLYNEYFRWKGTGKVITKHLFWCRLCMMAHTDDRQKQRYVSDYDRWWRPIDICKVNKGYQRWTPPTYGTTWS